MIFTKLFFIINPISGDTDKAILVKAIEKEFAREAVDLQIEFTKGPSHATDLAKEAAERGFELIVAVGGDGTVNETAAGLMYTNACMGILPLGSGNGLSRHMQIPNNPFAALAVIHSGIIHKVDVCTANGIPFFNVAGVGYDALIAHDFAQLRSRGFYTYIKSVLRNWFSYKPKKYNLKTAAEKKKVKALAISFANGSQFGNNFYISPDASMKDGLLDVCIIRKFPHSALPYMIYQMFSRGINTTKYYDLIRVREIKIKQKSKKAHLDGEPFTLGKKIHFKVLPQALNILAPKES